VFSMKISGLGDLVYVITKFTGIRFLYKYLFKKLDLGGCGCDERQEKLNVILPFKSGSESNK
jgi:hypothetical protein